MPNGAPEKKFHSILLEIFSQSNSVLSVKELKPPFPHFPAALCSLCRKYTDFVGTSQLSLLCASGDPGAFSSCPCGQRPALEMVLYEGVMWKDGAVTARLPLALSISWSHEKLLEPNAVCLVFGFPNSLRSVQTGPSEAVPLP